MSLIIVAILAVAIIIPVNIQAGDICQATTTDYTANDGLVLVSQAHIITFTANCPKDVVPLYAVVNGRTLTVVQTEDNRAYQISWTNELPRASSGSHEILVFDENGYQQYRKAQRSGGSGDAKPLFTLSYRHSSPYSGPLVRTEFAVLLITLMLAYHAITLRFKIMCKKI